MGFDSIATSGEEAREPTRSIPRATGLSMAIVTLGYILVSAALTLVEPYSRISRTAALPEAFDAHGIPWAKYVIRYVHYSHHFYSLDLYAVLNPSKFV